MVVGKRGEEETLKEEREEVTVFESGETLIGNLELKGGEKGSRVVEDGDVGDVHSTHADAVVGDDDDDGGGDDGATGDADSSLLFSDE